MIQISLPHYCNYKITNKKKKKTLQILFRIEIKFYFVDMQSSSNLLLYVSKFELNLSIWKQNFTFSRPILDPPTHNP